MVYALFFIMFQNLLACKTKSKTGPSWCCMACWLSRFSLYTPLCPIQHTRSVRNYPTSVSAERATPIPHSLRNNLHWNLRIWNSLQGLYLEECHERWTYFSTWSHAFEIQFYKLCPIWNYLWSAPFAIKFLTYLGTMNVMKGIIHFILP